MNSYWLIPTSRLGGEELLIGRPLLQHLRADPLKILEANREQLHETDCSTVVTNSHTKSSTHRIQDDQLEDRPKSPSALRVTDETVRNETDPYPDRSLLDTLDNDQREDVVTATADMLKRADTTAISKQGLTQLKKNCSSFYTCLSSWPVCRPARKDHPTRHSIKR